MGIELERLRLLELNSLENFDSNLVDRLYMKNALSSNQCEKPELCTTGTVLLHYVVHVGRSVSSQYPLGPVILEDPGSVKIKL
jgi:hypothetical protein